MIKFKKFLAAAMTGAMMLGVVASATPIMNVYATGEDTETPTVKGKYGITVHYDSMTAEITLNEGATRDPYVKLVVIKKNKDTEADEKKASSGIYTYAYPSDGSLTVDLSFLKLTKDPVKIRVYGSSQSFADATEATVNAQGGKIALSYTGGTGNITQAFKVGKGKSATAVTADVLATYEFRTLYGSEFKDLTAANFNVSITETAGTTLVVRKKAVTTGEEQCAASPEIKVKIAAAPKAPSIKIDYAKGTIGSLKNTKVEIYTTSGAAIEVKGTNVSGSAISFGDKVKALTPEEILKEGSIIGDAVTPYLKSGFILVVRTVKTGKADSNAAIVPVPAAGELEKDLTEDKISLNSKTLSWAWGKKSERGTDEGLKLTTSANKAFEYEVEKNGTKSWKSLKQNDFLALTDGAKLRVRLAGDKNATPPTLPSIPYEIIVKKVEKLAVDKEEATIKVNGTEGTTLKVTLGTTDVTNQVTWEVKKGETASTDLTVTNGVIKKAESATLTKDTEYTLTGTKDNQKVTVKVTVVE